MTSTTFENHAIFEKLSQFVSSLRETDAKDKMDTDKFHFFNLSVDFIADRLKLTIPILVQEADLTTAAQELMNATAQINSFLGNNNQGHLNNAENNIFSALTRIKSLPTPISKGDFNFSKTITSFETTVKEKLQEVDDLNSELNEELEQLQGQLTEKETKIGELTKLLEKKEAEIQNLNTKFQTEFETFKSTINTTIAEDRKKFRKEIDDDRTAIEEDSSAIIKELGKKLTEAKKIVNVIGNIGVTGNYQQIANSHKTQADNWRYVAIGFMAIFSGLLIYTIWDISTGQFDWVKSLIRIVAAAALSYPATYAAKESSKHRSLENYNRKSELELSSINPFIEMLDEAKRQAIKEKLVDKYFGNHDGFPESEGKQNDTDNLPVNGLEKILKVISGMLNK